MQFQLAYFLVTLAVISIASYTDIRKRIVPDWLSYSAIALGLALHALQSLLGASIFPIAFSAGLAALTFACGYVLWKLGVWAGGDVKLFTAIAALNPLNYAFLGQALFPQTSVIATISAPIFPLTLFIFSAVAVLPYGAIVALRAMAADKPLRKKVGAALQKNAIELLFFCLAAIGIGMLIAKFSLNPWIGLGAIIAWGFLRRFRKPASVALLAAGAWIDAREFAFQFAWLFVVLLAVYSVIKFYSASRKEVFMKRKKISELEEGEIVAESIVEEKGIITRVRPLEMGKIIKHLKSNNLTALREMLSSHGKAIVSHRRAMGVTVEEIGELKKLVREGSLEDSIEVKLSAPFVPAVLIAFIAASVLGDALWRVLL